MLNKVMLIGNVGQDPNVRYLEGNNPGAQTKTASLRIATSERFRDRDGNPQERTEWHSVVVWRSTADFVEKYVKKGAQVYVEGRLTTRTFTDRDGNQRSVTEIVADTLQLLGRREGAGDQGGYQGQGGYQQRPQGGYQNQGYAQGGQRPQGGYQQNAPQQFAAPAQPQYAQAPQQYQAPEVPEAPVQDNPDDDLPF